MTFPGLLLVRALPRPKIEGHAHSHTSGEEFVCMGDSAHSTGYEPKLLDKNICVDDDMTPINDPDHDSISDFSKTTREGTRFVSVPTVCELFSLSRVSWGNDGLPQENQPRETVRGQREREEREGSVISVGQSMSRTNRRNSLRSNSHQTQKEFYSDERDLREHLERRARHASLGENSAQRKFFSTECNMEIQNMERRNSEYALIESQRELESQRLQLSEANQRADQAQRERIHLCSELEMKSCLCRECYARSCREIEELKKRCYQEENAIRRPKLDEFPTQHDQESRTVRHFFLKKKEGKRESASVKTVDESPRPLKKSGHRG